MGFRWEEIRFIGIEDLNVRGMVRNHKLAKALADASFGEIRRQIEYKSKLSGSHAVVADRFYPSSKRCSDCGNILERLDLSEREWSCPSCGVIHDRDKNASINLRLVAERYSETLNACGEPVRPVHRRKATHRSYRFVEARISGSSRRRSSYLKPECRVSQWEALSRLHNFLSSSKPYAKTLTYSGCHL